MIPDYIAPTTTDVVALLLLLLFTGIIIACPFLIALHVHFEKERKRLDEWDKREIKRIADEGMVKYKIAMEELHNKNRHGPAST